MRWRAPLRGRRCATLSRFARLEPTRVLTLPRAIAGISGTKKAALLQLSFQDGGEGGIRTLDTLPYTHFPGVLLQPLGHLTVFDSLLKAWNLTSLQSACYEHMAG